MEVSGAVSVFLMGCGGGVIGEALHWWNLRKEQEFPAYYKSPFYWTLTTAMILIGGFVCWLYFGERVDGVLAVHVGLSAPLILQKLVVTMPEQSGARAMVAPRRPSVRSFFTW